MKEDIFRREAARRNRRDKAWSASVEPERRRRKKISEQLRVVPSFSPFFLLLSSLSFSPHYSLSRSRPSLSFYCFSRRRQTVANRIRGPLFTRSPATLCLLLANFGRSFSFLPSLIRLSLSLSSAPLSSLINEILATIPLLSRDRVLIAAVTANNFATTDRGSSIIYRSLV